MAYRPPPFSVINPLVDKIMTAMVEQPGAFKGPSSEAIKSLLIAFATGQFVIKIRKGEIKYFACFWCIRPEDIPTVEHRTIPEDITTGSIMYVVNAVNTEGKKGMAEIIRRLREKTDCKGVFWHRPAKQDRVYRFLNQQGTGVIHGKQ